MRHINQNKGIDSNVDFEDITELNECPSDDAKENQDDDDTVIELVPDIEVETEVNATEASDIFSNVDHELPNITGEEDNTVDDNKKTKT